MTTTRQDLYSALGQIQNHPACINQDIMTIAGMMTEGEIRQHIEANLRWIAKFNLEAAQTPARKRRAA